MKKIPLTQGQFAIVDDEDYDFLMKWKWHATWDRHTKSYRVQTIIGKRPHRTSLQMSRLLMETPVHLQCDHINHNTLDHQRENLRNVTCRENMENSRNQSRHGVSVYKRPGLRSKPYQCSIWIGGKMKSLGYFATPGEAQEARKKFLENMG